MKTKFIALSALCVFLTATLAYAATIPSYKILNIKGKVLSLENNIPLSGARVELYPFFGYPTSVLTDNLGNFEFKNYKLPTSAKYYILRARKTNYYPKTILRFTRKDKEILSLKGSSDLVIFKLTAIPGPTVEEALKKVADNYARISDWTADMVMTSTFNDKPFGETQFCRYYFKAPGKDKTETFSDNLRLTKTESIITNGSNIYLIDPVNKVTQKVDMLADTGLSEEQLNQIDLYYNQTAFLTMHNITKNILLSDYNNMIIALDVLPKNSGNTYDKLGLIIDYRKGILLELAIYKKNDSGVIELIQRVRTISSQEIANSAWLPVKMTKTPNSSQGNFTSYLTYINLQANIGLLDSDFNPEKE